jgi:hypothetical protein
MSEDEREERERCKRQGRSGSARMWAAAQRASGMSGRKLCPGQVLTLGNLSARLGQDLLIFTQQ